MAANCLGKKTSIARLVMVLFKRQMGVGLNFMG